MRTWPPPFPSCSIPRRTRCTSLDSWYGVKFARLDPVVSLDAAVEVEPEILFVTETAPEDGGVDGLEFNVAFGTIPAAMESESGFGVRVDCGADTTTESDTDSMLLMVVCSVGIEDLSSGSIVASTEG